MTARCEQCKSTIVHVDNATPPASWCSDACLTEWESEHPGVWVQVEHLTVVQRAELDAVIGNSLGIS